VAAGTTVIADGAYLGTGLIVPHRRRSGRPLLRGQEEDNAEHRRVRSRVEHTFARVKNWKILRDCRQKGAASTTPCRPSPPCTISPWQREAAGQKLHAHPHGHPPATPFRRVAPRGRCVSP
jgi:hypothetical protein